jgi:large conductance mechanosensitive channel
MKKIDPRKELQGFWEFIQEKGVIALAIGFILGGAITKMVSSLVNDLISPILGLALGKLENLKEAAWEIGSAKVMWGSFVSNMIDFVLMAAVVYFGVRILNRFGFQADKKKS